MMETLVHDHRPTHAGEQVDLTAVAERLLVGTRHEVTFLVPRYTPGALEFAPELAELVLRRGGRLRLVLQDDVADLPEVAEHAEWLGSRKIVPRTIDYVPTRALTIDRSIGVILEGPTRRLMCTRAAVRSLCTLADLLWERATPMAESLASQPTPRAQKILELLAEGLNDEAIARKLGVSIRTVRNDVAAAMSTMSAHSRLQAGVHAAQLGLV